MQLKVHIKKGDTVKVISGDAKGQEGRVLSVDRKRYKAIVEGINIVSKHEKPSAQNQDGGIVKKEAPIYLSKLMLVDGNGDATRIRRGKDKDGNAVRISVKTGQEIK